jgi:hypothetical protein
MAHKNPGVDHGDVVPVAADIYEREQFDAEGVGGSVQSDLYGLSLEDMEDYFGDLDPVAFL